MDTRTYDATITPTFAEKRGVNQSFFLMQKWYRWIAIDTIRGILRESDAQSMKAIQPIRSIVILGGGSAGLLAALTLKRKLPDLAVEVVYSSRIGVIGVGEGTTPYVPAHIHGYLGFDEHEVFNAIEPVYKLGIRFTWGPADHFDYTFSGRQQAFRYRDLTRNNGFYQQDPSVPIDPASALMGAAKVVPMRNDGVPDLPPPGSNLAWHIENKLFVSWLETTCRRLGVIFTDAELTGAVPDPDGGVRSIRLDDGSSREADLFVDASGFVSELLGRALGEPYRDFSAHLFCDRAVVGGWDRRQEPVIPYTLSDTMACGWCWRIDHPDRIHRGYVYSSDHLSDDHAEAEYRALSPLAGPTRVVKFRSGAYRRGWVGNVVAVGNAAGFVEPLEATALMVICLQSRLLTDGLLDAQQAPPPSMRDLYNRMHERVWDGIRDFLALHYRFNTRVDTPFWRRCRHETPLGGAEAIAEFYRENGPSAIASALLERNDPFGLDGYYAILCGQAAPHARPYEAPPAERALWDQRIAGFEAIAQRGIDMPALAGHLRDPAVWTKIRRNVAR